MNFHDFLRTLWVKFYKREREFTGQVTLKKVWLSPEEYCILGSCHKVQSWRFVRMHTRLTVPLKVLMVYVKTATSYNQEVTNICMHVKHTKFNLILNFSWICIDKRLSSYMEFFDEFIMTSWDWIYAINHMRWFLYVPVPVVSTSFTLLGCRGQWSRLQFMCAQNCLN